jgi:hypothetical protein
MDDVPVPSIGISDWRNYRDIRGITLEKSRINVGDDR